MPMIYKINTLYIAFIKKIGLLPIFFSIEKLPIEFIGYITILYIAMIDKILKK